MKKLLTSFLKPVNLSKVIIIFIVGIISRYSINNYFDINVFIDYSNYISILYYSFFSAFIVFINELFSLYNINIIPGFIIKSLDFIVSILQFLFVKPFIYFYTNKNIGIHYLNNPKSSKISGNIEFNREYYIKEGELHHYRELDKSLQNSENEYNNNSRNYSLETTYNKYYSIEQPSNNKVNFSYPLTKITEQHKINNTSFNHSLPRESRSVNPYFQMNSEITKTKNIHSTPTVNTLFSFDEEDQSSLRISKCNPNYIDMAKIEEKSNIDKFVEEGTGLPKSIYSTKSEPNLGLSNLKDNIDRDLENSNLLRSHFSISSSETSIYSSNIKEKLHLGKFFNKSNNIGSLYNKYHDIAKRKFFWNVLEKERKNYDSYEEFKANFDPKTKIWKEIAKITKKDLSKEIDDLLKTDPFETKQSKISPKNIRRLSDTLSQTELNEIGIIRNKTMNIPRK
uniref:hypothetical protein n=1 Tax=Pleurocordyceps sinensis TaxID=99896 RepID=UPI0021FE9F07|nr:hypothetical protein OOD12_mgp19 [Pleurocordyceps sinensis]UXR11748.1 hypothetical protein [Pleurocordyceps sinensis]